MTKFTKIAMLLTTSLALVACGGQTTKTEEVALQDGSYKVEEKAFDERGWKKTIEVVVAEGKISDVNYAEVNEAGASKVDDAEYQAMMKDKSGVGPVEYMAALEADLLEKQNAEAVETVSGATGSSEGFKKLATQALENAKNGTTETTIVE